MIRLDLRWLNSRCISWRFVKLFFVQASCLQWRMLHFNLSAKLDHWTSTNVTQIEFPLHIISKMGHLDIQQALLVMLAMLNLYCSHYLYCSYWVSQRSLSGPLKLSKDKIQQYWSSSLQPFNWKRKKLDRTSKRFLIPLPLQFIFIQNQFFNFNWNYFRVRIEVIIKCDHSGDLANSPWARLLI